MKPIVTVDFESKAIAPRPLYPPAPVGVAIKHEAEASRYYAFGHLAGGNNCTEAEARAALERVWLAAQRGECELLFHNAAFDCAVAVERWGLPELGWGAVHDTWFLAFLLDPHARTNGLKALAQSWLDWPPDEQDAVAAWVWANREQILAVTGEKVPSAKKTGAFIWCAPGDVVGPYANGDVDRTYALFREMLPLVERYGMTAAYARERQLLPILAANMRAGLKVDMPALEADIELYTTAFAQVEDALRGVLKASGLNFDADRDVADVLLTRGIVPEENWALTATGQLSTSKENLHPDLFTGSFNGATGAQVASALGYRNRLATCLKMFMLPWAQQARASGGTIHPTWNQVSSDQGGTRTGRPSMRDPNLLNISKDFSGRDDGYVHPDFLGLPPLPLCRKYVTVEEGYTFGHRDFNGQELRLFGNFERGDLFGQYQQDARLDVHAFVGAELMRVAGREIERTRVKTLNFQAIYGGGVPALQRKLRCTLAEAKELKKFHDEALPGRKALAEAIKATVAQGLPIATIGGRLYFPEPPGPDGRSKVYKLTNYIIQGSAADLTKEAILTWDAMNKALPKDQRSRFLIQVYDEINLAIPTERVGSGMRMLRHAMEMPRLGVEVPILSDGKTGPNWGSLTKYVDNQE